MVIVLAGLQAQAVGDPGRLFLMQGPSLVVSALLGPQCHILLEREQQRRKLKLVPK